MRMRPCQLCGIALALAVAIPAAGAGTNPATRPERQSGRGKTAAGPATAAPSGSASRDIDPLLAAGHNACEAGRPAEGLVWFRQAASAGSQEGVYQVGQLLLRGAAGQTPAQSVSADVPEGVRWIFWAATNRHPAACRQMAELYRHGLGVKTNLVEAYAWLRLSAALAPEFATDLDKLAPRLEPAQVIEAQQRAAQFLRGEWPPPPCKRIVPGDERLSINGLTLAQNRPSVVINHRTFIEGETAEVPIRGGQLVLTCVEIRPDAVLVEIAGEDVIRLLSLR